MNQQDTILTPHPGKVPSTPILWPISQHVSNQVQQTKGSAKPFTTNVRPTTQPNQSAVSPRTTPAKVSHVRVVTKPAVNGQKQITVQFNHPGGDPYFAGANIYLKKGKGQPAMVASVAKSPATFTVPVSTAPHSIVVSSVGNWGETPVNSSPSARVRLV
jgi:hypothetical protein